MTELTKDEEYQIVSKHLTGLTNFRKFAQTKDFDWLDDVCGKLSGILDEKREEEELRKLELAEQEEKRLKALKYLEELGIDPDTINVSVFDKAAKRKKKKAAGITPAKYRFTHPETGETDTWTGIGRMKKGLQQLLDAGHSLDEYLIEKSRDAKDELNEAEKLFEQHPSALG